MECNKDEALRAKEIAERKFAERDIAGAKKFALKAQNLYPGLDGICQMLATVDVHLSAANKIGDEMDWYGILGVSHMADDNEIKKQYRKLVLQLHPDKNKGIGAGSAFQFVKNAVTILSDKGRRAMYDQKIRMYQSVRLPSRNVFSSGQPFVRQQTAPVRTGFPGATSSAKPAPKVNPTVHNGVSAATSASAKQDGFPSTTFCSNKSKGSVPGQSRASVVPPTSNGDHKTSQQSGSKHKHAKTMGSIPCPKSGYSATTFWTRCDQCRVQYEYLERYLNQVLLCPHCNLGFMAIEIPAPSSFDTVPRWIRKHHERMLRDEILQRKQDGARIASGLKNSHDPSVSLGGGTSSKRSREKDDNLRSNFSDTGNRGAGSQGASNIDTSEVQRAASVEKQLRQTARLKKSKLSVSGVDIQGVKSKKVEICVPDSDFHDFSAGRSGNCFNSNEVWAVYDDEEGMPRHYGMIHEVVSLRPFRVKMSWLESRSTDERGRLDQVGHGFTKTYGEFMANKFESNNSLNSFSHKVKWMKGSRGIIRIYPMKGDIWALYRNWSPDWSEETPVEVIHVYEMVEVLNDFSDEHGISVAPIVKANGFRTIFYRQQDIVRRIPKHEMSRFSHQVPTHNLSSEEAPSVPQGSLELDPAATPLQFLLN